MLLTSFSRALVLFYLLSVISSRAAEVAAPAGAIFFPKSLNPALPYDVDIPALRALSDTPQAARPPYDIPDENIAPAQRLFDIFAWKSFLALNWPANDAGVPDTSKTLADTVARRVWEFYIDASQVYREDGAVPETWHKGVKASWDQRVFTISGMGIGKHADTPNKHGVRSPPVLDESLQAFTGPMVDQAGHWVRYQEVLNPIEFDYLVDNKLYNLDGQAAFTARRKIEFPSNNGTSKYGAMEVKTSWKQLSERDDPGRFLVRHAQVVRLDGTKFEADFAMVGMHIAVRTESSPTWIWSTFEHVDNTAVNDLQKDSRGRDLRPSFYNPNYPTKVINQLDPKNSAPVRQYDPKTGKDTGPEVFTSWDESKTTDPTQTTMVVPIPKITAALNLEVQSLLSEIGSVFRYYELIGTQWPVRPSFPAFSSGVATQPDGRLLPSSPESILFKVPGKVVPVYLINTTMETFFQVGNQAAGPQAEDDRLPPGVVADPSHIFATESCVGCHFSAGACIGFKRDANGRFLVQSHDGKNYRVPAFGRNALRGVNGNADYSWLMQLRSQGLPYEGADVVPLETALIPAQ